MNISKKALVSCLGAAVMMCCVCSCSNSGEQGQESSTDSTVSVSDNSKTESTADSSSEGMNSSTSISASSSSVNSPLEIGSWGTCAKYCTKTSGYINVPVCVTGVSHGKEAEKTVRDFAQKSNAFVYRSPEKNEEWAVISYKLSLDGFPVDKGGTLVGLHTGITDISGEPFNKDGRTVIPSTIDMSGEAYAYEGIVSGQAAVLMPESADEYLIYLGEYNETQAFFSVKY